MICDKRKMTPIIRQRKYIRSVREYKFYNSLYYSIVL